MKKIKFYFYITSGILVSFNYIQASAKSGTLIKVQMQRSVGALIDEVPLNTKEQIIKNFFESQKYFGVGEQ